MLATIHYAIQERRQVVQASWLKHFQRGYQNIKVLCYSPTT